MEDIELVIKIPKAYYELVIKRCKDPVLLNAFKNGTPLPKGHNGKNDVLDKIRAEIEQIIGEHNLDDYDFCSGLICARKIIDKYRGE